MSNNNVKNFFEQAPGTSTGGTTDNALNLGGTVKQADGTQGAFVVDATDLASAITLVNALKAIAINTGFMAPS